MALTDSVLSLFSFKNLLGKSMTDYVGKPSVGNEAESISLNPHASTVFVDDIDSNPATAISEGIAILVQADLVADITSNGRAFFAEWPATPPSGTDPTTSSPYAYGEGLLLNISAGDRVRNGIDTKFSDSYEAKPFSAGPTSIPVLDARDWIYQYNSGIFFQQTANASPTPTRIDVYVYVGKFLSDFISNTGGSGIGNKKLIEVSDVIENPEHFQYFLYGDMTIQGDFTNRGELVLQNGNVIIDGGSFGNFGDILLVTVPTGVDSQVTTYQEDFTLVANTPLSITHNLGTLDFIWNARSGNDEIEIQLTRINNNEVQIESTVNISGTINFIAAG